MKRYIYVSIAAIMIFMACKKNNSIIDGGLSNPVVNMNTYDFLASHSRKAFDTTLMIIDKAGLKDVINGDATFFVPNNYSINNFLDKKRAEARKIDELKDYTLDSLFKYFTPQMLRDSMGIYIFKGKLTYEQFPENGKMYTSLVTPNQQALIKYTTTRDYLVPGVINTPARLLYLVKIVGEPDVYDANNQRTDPSGDPKLLDIVNLCQTSGIHTTNGIVHVLQNQHIWTFKQ
jgi:hypothetical protein